MKKVHSWFLPDYDKHYEEWMNINNETTYQRLQREYALNQVKNFRTAIDIGGNIGFWSRDFCDRFENVIIFEPDTSNIECLEANLSDKQNYVLHKVGLGSMEEVKTFYKSLTTSGGHSFFRDQVFEDQVEESQLQIKRLDDYEYKDVGLIKIDTQGSEYDILLGAEQTLFENDCVLNVEIEHKNEAQRTKGKQIISYLDSLGYSEFGRSRKKEVIFTKRRKA
jgi:FkbM family methyltransferase